MFIFGHVFWFMPVDYSLGKLLRVGSALSQAVYKGVVYLSVHARTHNTTVLISFSSPSYVSWLRTKEFLGNSTLL